MLEAEIRDLARGKNFAALTVIPKSGHPMTHINALSNKYTGSAYGFGPTDRRIIYRIEPIRQRTM